MIIFVGAIKLLVCTNVKSGNSYFLKVTATASISSPVAFLHKLYKLR